MFNCDFQNHIFKTHILKSQFFKNALFETSNPNGSLTCYTKSLRLWLKKTLMQNKPAFLSNFLTWDMSVEYRNLNPLSHF